MDGVTWNLWHGCHKLSEGCRNCYVFRTDAKYERDSERVVKTKNFRLPVLKNRQGEYKYPEGATFYTCFTSDFFLEDADGWRDEVWEIIRERSDCTFLFITKRILRFYDCIPQDWADGYDNVIIGCTAENQKRADERMPFFVSLPIKHRISVHEPLLEGIDIEKYIAGGNIDQVIVGGESGECARDCNYDWVLSIREQCVRQGVTFRFKQTGARFIKDGRRYSIPRREQHRQAVRANIEYTVDKEYI